MNRGRRVRSTVWLVVKRLLQLLVALQLSIVATLTAVDAWRKRSRPTAEFPRTPPDPVPVSDGEVTVYTYGEDLYADMLAAIRRARHQVLFESFIWKGDPVGEEFKRALIDAAARGVEVYAVYDGFANLVVPGRFKRFPPTLQVHEHPVVAPGWRLFDLRRYGRDHRKILVVDGEVAFVGGYNVGATYATDWRDTHARITGSAVWDLKNAFVDFWNQHRNPAQPALRDEGATHWEPRIRVHRNVPRQWVFPIRGMYLEAIDRASRYIYLTHGYFMPDHELLRALLSAARREVDVRLLVPQTSNHVVADWLSRGFYSTMLRGGIRLFLYRGAMVHAKTATIDGRWSTIGTANLDRVSLTGNYEVNVEFFDDRLAARMEEIFAADCGNARELTLEEWSRRPFVAKFSETVLGPLRPLL
ncbi:MAG: phosphatidylserine/phosphatidylglycerophosphate/cardiolipin synthase family protein [Propionibacteriales bacterium]|nr:phosphatidylserine/phosphatidylglycerophosphate/cardiolipin synthase family protein [Propionibacteriales bacterium]